MKRGLLIGAVAAVVIWNGYTFFQEEPFLGGGDRYQAERERMVDRQIEPRGIHDTRLLAAMKKVPRHLFIPQPYRSEAYTDHAVPIGLDQTISQPYIVALMTDLLRLEPSDTVLEIGTGSGYQAAVLGELASHVYTIEIIPELAARTDTLLDSLGYDNIDLQTGDGYAGWPAHAPFRAIIVTAAPPSIPPPLLDQLADSGRMVIPVGTDRQSLLLLEKIDGTITRTEIAPVRFVPMTGDSVDHLR